MDKSDRKEFREQAWKYFGLHAEQRLKTFHFFLILAALISGAVATIAKDGKSFLAAAAISFLLPCLSFIFWKLDTRNKQFIKHAEDAIKLIEQESGLPDDGDEPHRLKLFLHEEYVSKSLVRMPKAPPWSAHFSYSTCFKVLFLLFGVSGFITATILILVFLTTGAVEPEDVSG